MIASLTVKASRMLAAGYIAMGLLTVALNLAAFGPMSLGETAGVFIGWPIQWAMGVLFFLIIQGAPH